VEAGSAGSPYPRNVDEERTVSRLDALLPAGLLAVAAVELVTAQPDGWAAGLMLSAAAAGLLVLRKSRPLVFATLAMALLAAMPFFGPQLDDVAAPILYLAVAIYSLARWLPDLRGLIGLGVVLCLLLVDYVAVDARAHGFGDIVFVLSLALPPYVFGRVTRRLAEQGRLLEENQELVRRQAVPWGPKATVAVAIVAGMVVLLAFGFVPPASPA